jgi:predicted secreted protein
VLIDTRDETGAELSGEPGKANLYVLEHITVVEHLDGKVSTPSQGEPPTIPETPAKEVWTFVPLSEGKCIIHLEYRRAWEENVANEKMFTLTVIVK